MSILGTISSALGDVVVQKKIWSLADAIWGYICLFSAPLGAGVILYWSAQSPAVDAIVDSSPSSSAVYELKAEESLYIDSPIQFSSTIDKVAYRARLIDEMGGVAYAYPEILVSKSSGFRGLDFSLRLPHGLYPGTYYLRVEAIYPLNPIKNASINVEAAKIVINYSPEDAGMPSTDAHIVPFLSRYRKGGTIQAHPRPSIEEKAYEMDINHMELPSSTLKPSERHRSIPQSDDRGKGGSGRQTVEINP